ncbi:MAG: hypothetical protein LBG26_06005, partial [Treponema sp.]|nr:hypothetical protein [Treponema sp.]
RGPYSPRKGTGIEQYLSAQNEVDGVTYKRYRTIFNTFVPDKTFNQTQGLVAGIDSRFDGKVSNKLPGKEELSKGAVDLESGCYFT